MNTRTLLAKIHIAKKQLGLDDDAYHAIVARHGDGKISCRDLTIPQMNAVLREFISKGWTPKPPKSKGTANRKLATGPEIEKIRALWLWMHQLGIVRDPSESALASYARRMAGIDDLHWADGWRCHRLIETLKKWAQRELPSKLGTRLQQLQAMGLIDPRNTLAGLLESCAGSSRRTDTFQVMCDACDYLDRIETATATYGDEQTS
jgi:phage gp16-like protein